MIEELRNKAKELLNAKQADIIIGYQRASDNVSATPCFVDNAGAVDKLIWDAYCVYNLSGYLKDFPGKIKAIVAKACDIKSIIVLLQENQLKREEVFIIGVECAGVTGQETATFEKKCRNCETSMPRTYDFLLKEKENRQKTPQDKDEYETIKKLEAKSGSERFKFWAEEFSRCIRCYACRQVCPLCYCPKCVADQTMPAWFSRATALEGNLSWNITRAMHLAARCIDCGECERVCPVGIPLRSLNKKLEKDIKELFNYEAGLSAEQKPLFSCFDKNDPADFIK